MLHSLLRHGRSSQAEHQLAASNWLAQCSDRTQQVTLAAGLAAGRCSWHEQLARVTSLATRSDLRHHLRRLKSHASASKESSLNRKMLKKPYPLRKSAHTSEGEPEGDAAMDGSRRCHEEVLPAFSPPAFPLPGTWPVVLPCSEPDPLANGLWLHDDRP